MALLIAQGTGLSNASIPHSTHWVRPGWREGVNGCPLPTAGSHCMGGIVASLWPAAFLRPGRWSGAAFLPHSCRDPREVSLSLWGECSVLLKMYSMPESFLGKLVLWKWILGTSSPPPCPQGPGRTLLLCQNTPVTLGSASVDWPWLCRAGSSLLGLPAGKGQLWWCLHFPTPKVPLSSMFLRPTTLAVLHAHVQ